VDKDHVLKRPDHAFGFGLKDPMPLDGSMSGYFLLMDNMSPDGLRDYDKESMEDGHYGG